MPCNTETKTNDFVKQLITHYINVRIIHTFEYKVTFESSMKLYLSLIRILVYSCGHLTIYLLHAVIGELVKHLCRMRLIIWTILWDTKIVTFVIYQRHIATISSVDKTGIKSLHHGPHLIYKDPLSRTKFIANVNKCYKITFVNIGSWKFREIDLSVLEIRPGINLVINPQILHWVTITQFDFQTLH